MFAYFFSQINFKIIIYAPADVHWVIPIRNDHAAENPTGIILVVAITIVLAMMVLLMAMQLLPDLRYDPTVPDIFQITDIKYTLSADGVNYIGLVDIFNADSRNYRNRYIRVNTFVNDIPADCNIPTLNNELFISQAVHTGVSDLSGGGTWGGKDSPLSVWPANSGISIQYKKGRLHPGNKVTLEFVDTTTGQLISRDTYPHDNGIQERCMRMYLSHQGA
jgi:hypothetical protein